MDRAHRLALEIARHGVVVLVGDLEDDEPRGRIARLQPLERGHLLDAGRAPGRPDVDQDDAAPEVGQATPAVLSQVGELEGRRRLVEHPLLRPRRRHHRRQPVGEEQHAATAGGEENERQGEADDRPRRPAEPPPGAPRGQAAEHDRERREREGDAQNRDEVLLEPDEERAHGESPSSAFAPGSTNSVGGRSSRQETSSPSTVPLSTKRFTICPMHGPPAPCPAPGTTR